MRRAQFEFTCIKYEWPPSSARVLMRVAAEFKRLRELPKTGRVFMRWSPNGATSSKRVRGLLTPTTPPPHIWTVPTVHSGTGLIMIHSKPFSISRRHRFKYVLMKIDKNPIEIPICCKPCESHPGEVEEVSEDPSEDGGAEHAEKRYKKGAEHAQKLGGRGACIKPSQRLTQPSPHAARNLQCVDVYCISRYSVACLQA